MPTPNLTLYSHPLSSFCHKVLIALYECERPFTHEVVNFGDPVARDAFFALSPIGKIPVLRDETAKQTVPETTIMMEYLEQHYPTPRRLFPSDAKLLLNARYWDRFLDLYIHNGMQRIVADRLRSEDKKDPTSVDEAKALIHKAYDVLNRHMKDRIWVASDEFSFADCAASPALFYAGIIVPFTNTYPHVTAYFERLLERPAYRRVLKEAQPFFQYFPFKEAMPQRFLEI